MTGSATILRGDARHLPLADESVDLIVTSPPFYALRSYTDGGEHYAGQIGSESTPAECIDALVECTAEMVRVLKPSGSIFVDLGDKYSGYSGNNWGHGRDLAGERGDSRVPIVGPVSAPTVYGTPNKSLMLLPERYRIAAVDRLGLIARAIIVWDKPNGLPESVTDRVRRNHEEWVHLTRLPRYYAAVDEIREPQTGTSHGSRRQETGKSGNGVTHRSLWTHPDDFNPLGKLPGSVWTIATEPLTVPDHLGVDHFAAYPTEWPRRIIAGWSPPGVCLDCGQGRRPVVQADYEHINHTTNAKSQAGEQIHNGNRTQHTSVVSRKRVTILGYACACTPHTDHPGTGETSGAKYSVAIEDGTHPNVGQGWEPSTSGKGGLGDRPRVGPWREYHLDGWTSPPTRPAIILDPFGGTGTTALVAKALGRCGIHLDASADYNRIATWRTRDPQQLGKASGIRGYKPPAITDGQLTLDGAP